MTGHFPSQGPRPFYLVNGILLWGLILVVVCTPVAALIRGWHRIILNLPYTFSLFPIGGYLIGVWRWRYMEKHYGESVDRDAET
jgi:hypothetical protein